MLEQNPTDEQGTDMRSLLCLLALLCLTTSVCYALDLYVAPNGSDQAPGTRAQPLATLQQARDAIRALKQQGPLPAGGVTVYLRGGTYYLPASVEFTAQDSGTAEAPIVYRAFAKEQVWINGGKRPDSALWRPVTDAAVLQKLDPAARGKVVQLDLKAAGVPQDVEQLPDAFRGFTNNHPVLMELFSGGKRLQLARWPNEGFAQYGEIVDSGSGLRDPKGPKRPARFTVEDDRVRRWNVEDGVWLNGYWARAYLCESVRIAKIDKEKRELEWAVPLGYGLDSWGAKRFFAFNLLCELDMPGEWFLDRKAQILYLWPSAPLKKSPVTISCVATPLLTLKNADYLTFRGLGFENGRQDAISMSDSSHNRVIACTIRNMGMNAVMIGGGADCGVQGCDIYDTGYAGIRLSGGDRKTLTPCNHFADNNHIHDTSIIRRTHAGPISLTGVGLRAAHNLIHHEPHTAIWYNGNDIVMEYNDIYSVMLETTEGGVFYTGYDWTYRGDVIRYNYIHHIPDRTEGMPTRACIVHEDDCSSGTAFEGNLCLLTGEGVAMCGGPDNTADNNIFINCNPAIALSARGLDWWTWTRHPDGKVTVVDRRNGATMNNLLKSLDRVPYKEGPWLKYPHLATILDTEPIGAPWYCSITRNIAVGGKLAQISGNVKPEWITVKDNWDNEGDPGFVNLAKGDYHLRPDAPVIKKIGFVPLPIDQMGLINDGTRATWPVKPEPPPKDFKPYWMKQAEQQAKSPTALPVVRVPRAFGKITIDGAVNAEEYAPAQATGMTNATSDPTPLAWNYDGKPAPFPSKAWLQVDDSNLYVAFINDTDPATGVSGGRAWGKDDAVEIALAAMQGDKLGPIIVLRGFSDGFFTSSNEAEAPAPIVKRALQGTEYACKVADRKHWTAEWKIPFAALGLQPKKQNPVLLFSLSVRKPAGDLWVMWKKGGGFTWEVKNGGLLWLEPFGDVTMSAAAPSQANVHVMAATPGLTLKAGKNCEVATWSQPLGGRLTAASEDLKDRKWRDWEFTFVPSADGKVSVNLMGRGYRSETTGNLAPVWTYYDDLTCEGADLRNGSFEELDAKGQPVGWTASGALVIRDPGVAASGSSCVKCWHDGRFVQTLEVKKDQPVRLRLKARGETSSR